MARSGETDGFKHRNEPKIGIRQVEMGADTTKKMEQEMYDMNHEYHIKGSPRVLSKVVQEINQFRSEYCEDPDRDRICNPVRKNNDGTLSWSGCENSLMWDLDDSFVGLTRSNATKILACHGETNDDCILGYVYLMEKGDRRQSGFWDADVGFQAGMAAIELEKSANVDAAMVLLKNLERACERPGRLSAVLAEMLPVALDRSPALASDDSIWTRIMRLQGQIAASDIKSETASGDRDMDSQLAKGLFAKLEAKKLKEVLTPPTGQACLPKAVRL